MLQKKDPRRTEQDCCALWDVCRHRTLLTQGLWTKRGPALALPWATGWGKVWRSSSPGQLNEWETSRKTGSTKSVKHSSSLKPAGSSEWVLLMLLSACGMLHTLCTWLDSTWGTFQPHKRPGLPHELSGSGVQQVLRSAAVWAGLEAETAKFNSWLLTDLLHDLTALHLTHFPSCHGISCLSSSPVGVRYTKQNLLSLSPCCKIYPLIHI